MTRNNLCTNPKAGSNLTGWGGGTTPARATGQTGFPSGVTTAAQYTGNGYISTPPGAAAAGTTYTISVYVKNDATFDASGRTMYFVTQRSAGGDDFSQTATATTMTVGNVTRVSFTATAVTNATGVYLLIDSMNGTFGTGFYVSACLIEQSATADTYFDGDSASASWDGTAQNSSSTLVTSVSPAPTGLPIPVALGTATSSASITTAPSGVAVPVAMGVPATAYGLATAPTPLAIPVAVGQPSIGQPAASPAGLAIPVAIGQPSVALARSASPAGLAILVALGQPSPLAPVATDSPNRPIVATSGRSILVATTHGRAATR